MTRAAASRRSRLTRLRSTAPPTLRETVRPTRGSLALGAGIARERVDDEVPRRRRAAAPVDGVEVGRAREAPAARSGTRHDLGREVLAPAQAAALEDGAARARTHALAEAVLLCALALVGLIGALHVSSSGSAGREKRQCSRRAGRRSRMRRAVDNRRAARAPPGRDPAQAVALRHPRASTWPVDDAVDISRVSATSGFSLPPRAVARRVDAASIRSPRPVRTASIDTPLAPWTCVAMPVDDSSTPDLLWTAVADRIRDDLSPMVFGAWFSTTRALALEGDVLEVGVPNEFTRAWIEGHFAELVRSAATAADPGVSVRFRVADGEPAPRAPPLGERERTATRKPKAGRASAAASRAGRAAALEVHVRLVRDRQLQPLRARRRARRRRGARAGLQPARDLRRHRPRQDAPAAGDRALRAHARARACAPAT